MTANSLTMQSTIPSTQRPASLVRPERRKRAGGRFLSRGLALAAMALAGVLSWPSAAGADQWTQYDEPRSGMRIEYPSGIFTQSVATDDGHQFLAPDAELEISARDGIGVRSTEELRDLMINSKDYSRLTYSPGGRSWMVASGYRGENIYYEKFFVRNGEVRAFSVQYPKSMRSLYDPIVERLEDTFHPWQ